MLTGVLPLLLLLLPLPSPLSAFPPNALMPGQCPQGHYPDGSCAILHLCIDPHERCLGGICCEPVDMFPSMPFGYNFGMPLSANHLGPFGQELIPPRACMDFEQSCLSFAHMCNLPSVAEVCIRTCQLCNRVNFAAPYAPYGIWSGNGK